MTATDGPAFPSSRKGLSRMRRVWVHLALLASIVASMLLPWVVLLAGAASIYLLYYLFVVAQRPELAVRQGPFQIFLQNHVPILRERYWPAIFCLEARAQMVVSVALRAAIPPPPYRRELLTLSDGGEVAVDWLDAPQENGCLIPPPTSLVALLMPGLTGDSRGGYMRSLAITAWSQGFTVAVFNFRGLGGVPLKTPRTFCATNSDDLSEIIEHIRRKFPGVRLVALGVSMGAMILGHYLVSLGEKAKEKVEAVMLISAAWNVPRGIANMEASFLNRKVLDHLARNMRRIIRRDRAALEGKGPWDVDVLVQSRTIFEVDNLLTAPLFGYANADEYYQATSLGDNLLKIRVPVLGMSAADDPLSPYSAIPLSVARRSSHVAIAVTSRGGHVAFLEGWWPRSRNYMEKVFAQFLSAVVNYGDELRRMEAKETEDLTPSTPVANHC